MISTLTKVLVPALMTLAASSAFANVAPPSGSVKIKNITAIGSGCKTADTYSTNISEDGAAFTITFSEFAAQLADGISILENRKNCSVTLDLQVPNGWQFSVATFNYRGYLDMTKNIQASHTTTYFFQGADGRRPENTGRFERVQNGPAAGEFVLTDKIGLTSVYIPSTWSPCNVQRALTLNPSISLRKLKGATAADSAVMVNDSIDGEIVQEFGLVWRKCNG